MSQIASLTRFSFTVTVVVLKSIPIVAGVSALKVLSTKRSRRQDLKGGGDQRKA